MHATDTKGGGILHATAEHGHSSTLRYAVSAYGIPTNLPRTSDGKYPLHIAAGSGSTLCVKELVELGAQRSVTDKGGCWTPLHYAAVHGHMGAAEALLVATDFSGGLDAGTGEEEDLLLTVGRAIVNVFAEEPSIAQRLLLKSAVGGSLAVHEASAAGRTECLKFLLEREPSLTSSLVEARKKNGETPLMTSAKNGQEDTLKFLLSLGADVAARDFDDRQVAG